MKVKDLIARLEKWKDQDQHVCAQIWTREDIQSLYHATDAEADEILDDLEHTDCEVGVNWESLQYACDAAGLEELQ
jgi:hypothetical protein